MEGVLFLPAQLRLFVRLALAVVIPRLILNAKFKYTWGTLEELIWVGLPRRGDFLLLYIGGERHDALTDWCSATVCLFRHSRWKRAHPRTFGKHATRTTRRRFSRNARRRLDSDASLTAIFRHRCCLARFFYASRRIHTRRVVVKRLFLCGSPSGERGSVSRCTGDGVGRQRKICTHPDSMHRTASHRRNGHRGCILRTFWE